MEVTIFELKLLLILFLHLIKESIDLMLVLAGEHFEFGIIFVVDLLNLLIKDVLMVTYLDHVLFDRCGELVNLLLEFLNDLALLTNN